MMPLKGLRRVRDMTGTTVMNRQGEELGFLYDLMISNEGCVKYAILSYGGFLGVGDRLIPIPWRMLMDAAHTVVIDVDRKSLDNAPSFDDRQWPLMSEVEWQATVEKYFGQLSGKGSREGEAERAPMSGEAEPEAPIGWRH